MARLRAGEREVVRRRLLEAAARRFAELGVDGAGVDAISVAAGFAKGTIYNYFASKEDLLDAVLEDAARRVAERFASSDDPGRDTRSRLAALARADVAELREHEGFFKVVVREALTFRPSRHARLTAHLAPFVAAVERVLASGMTRGEVGRERPASELALLFTGLLALLYGQRWASEGVSPALEDIPTLATDLFLDGARGRGAR